MGSKKQENNTNPNGKIHIDTVSLTSQAKTKKTTPIQMAKYTLTPYRLHHTHQTHPQIGDNAMNLLGTDPIEKDRDDAKHDTFESCDLYKVYNALQFTNARLTTVNWHRKGKAFVDIRSPNELNNNRIYHQRFATTNGTKTKTNCI
eukprot:918477_1